MHIAAYATVDNNFVPYAIVALYSFKKYFPYIDCFVVTSKGELSEKNKGILKKHSISVIDGLWFKKIPSVKKKWPPVCYAMLEAPEILYKLGYSHSIGLDADTLCMQQFDLSGLLQRTKNFAGIANQESIYSNFLNTPGAIKILENFFSRDPNQIATLVNPNTGVIFWNNEWAKKNSLCQISDICLKAFAETLMPGDQALLAAVIAVNNIEYNILGLEYNFRLGNPYDQKANIKKADVVVAHFTASKPWEKLNVSGLNFFHLGLKQYFFRKCWYKTYRGLFSNA